MTLDTLLVMMAVLDPWWSSEDAAAVAAAAAPVVVPSVMVRSRDEAMGAALAATSFALTERLMAEWGTNAPGVLYGYMDLKLRSGYFIAIKKASVK